MIDWDRANMEDYKAAKEIVDRATKEACFMEVDPMGLQMDIVATHISGCKLKLQELLKAAKSDFFHDVAGIHRHIDRETGKLLDCFLPRYADLS